MMTQSLFKEQLFEYVEDREEPFDLDFLKMSCNQFVEENRFQSALYELEEEGKLVRLNHHYLSTRILMRQWIRERIQPHEAELKPFNDFLSIPDDLMGYIHELLSERSDLGYLDVDEFIRDAIRRRIQQFKKRNVKS